MADQDPYAAIATPDQDAVDTDPYASLATPEPAAAGTPEVDPYAAIAAPVQSTASKVVNQAVQGALDQGFYSGVGGAARAVASSPVARLSDRFADWAQEKIQGFPLTAEQKAMRAEQRGRSAENFGAANRTVEAYAEGTDLTRQSIRAAAPVDPEFARSLSGQIVAGLGQVSGTLPLYAIPGAGPGVTIGQMFDQGYQDAKQSGADDATARDAGYANIPAAALDVAADRLVIGKILKPLKGKLTVGQLLKSVGAGALSQGGSEGAQQLWQNYVAKELVGYDPNRQLDDQVINSIIVGTVVGGVATGVGQGVAQAAAPSDANTAVTAVNQTAANASPVTDEAAAAFGGADPYAALATPAEPAAAPEAPAAPPPLKIDYTEAPGLDEAGRAAERRLGDILKADPVAAIAAYREANTRDGVLTIDTDRARELSPDYALDKESRGRLAAAVHEPASALAKAAYTQALAETPQHNRVVFLAGGGGSGKSASLELGGTRAADIVYDSTLANLDSARARIKQALDSGRDVTINYVFRPQALSWEGVEKRRLKDGRSVPFDTFQQAHENALLNILELRTLFARDNRVDFKFIDNSGSLADISQVSWRDVVRRYGEDPKLDEAGAQLITQEINNGIEQRDTTAPQPDAGGGQGSPEQAASPSGESGAPGRTDGRSQPAPPAIQRGDRGLARPGARSGGDVGRFVAKLPGGGEAVSGRWRVVDAGDLVTSQDPGYRSELQPRDRTRAASEQQISRIVSNLDPELLAESLTTDLGAPIIDRGNQVLSGNGRSLALRDAYTSGEAGARYRDYLLRRAADFGLDPQDINALAQPVLVREARDFGGLTPTEFARRSNQRQVLGMSESENAAADSRRLVETPELLRLFNPSPEGDVLAAGNREFLNQFVEATGDGAELLARDGTGYSPKLAVRVRNAVLGALLGSDQRATLDQLLEAPEGLRKVVNSLLVAAPRLLRFAGTPYDLGPAIARAARDYITATRAGESIETYLAQGDMMRDRTRTPESEAVLRLFAEAKSAKRLGDFFDAYARVASQQDTESASMFGDTAARSPLEVIDFARNAAANPEATDTELSFARRTGDPERLAADHARLAERQAQWRTNAESVAPGLMQSFRLAFGDPQILVTMGRADARTITGAEQAAYLGHERMLFLFDQALARETDKTTLTNLLHEMGHAHWDTLPSTRQEELLAQWREETSKRTGPLYTRGKLKAGVAQGIEGSAREWYAERIAWVNHGWARARISGSEAPSAGLAGRMAQTFRQLLVKLAGYVEQLRGVTINKDFRTYLDQGERFAERAGQGGSDMARRAPETPEFKRWFGESKATDSQGRPLVVYRGEWKARPGFREGVEIYFSDSPEVASAYSQPGESGGSANVTPAWLSLQNPVVIDAKGADWNPVIPDALKAARAAGRDGVIVRNVRDGFAQASNKVATTFVVFDPRQVKSSIGNRGTFNPADPRIDFARRTPAQISQDALTSARSWLRRNLTSAAGLPAPAFDAKLAKSARLASVAKQIEFALRDFDRALHVVYGGYRAMTTAQLGELNDVLGGQLPLSAVDPRLHAPLTTMRDHIDTLSARLVREGAVDAKVAARVSGNLGFYLNRSYAKFDNPNWVRDVPEAVRNRAETFIAAQLAAQNPGQPVDPREVRGYVDYLLSKDTANESLYREPGREGAMALDVLKARKDIPPELRALMGEYLDPRVNYLRSVAKSAQILEANRFLKDVRQAGLGKWLFPRPITDSTGSYSTPIAGKDSKSMGALAGLYTTPEIAAAFQAQAEAAPGVTMRAWLALNGWAKIAKTVLSPVTQTRNLLGNLGFLVAGAHWRADAAAEVWQAMRADFGLGDTPASRAYLARLARLGILGESVNAGELREALNDAGGKLAGFERWTDSRLMRAARLPFTAAARLYQLNDEVFKIYAFENERRRWAKIDPSMTAEQLDKLAAERVRNTLPTYSLIPRGVQQVRRVGLTGSFLSFPSEILRTGYHSIRYALEDLAAVNPRQKAAGAARLAGLVTVASLPAALSMTTRWLANIDKDDEDDLRRFLPEWSRNSSLYFTGADGTGRFELIDASYLDPWSYLKKPIGAALRGEDWQTSLAEASREAVAPFAGEGLVTAAALDLARNRDAQGRQVFNPQAPFLDRASDQLAHVWQVYEPGAVTQARRIVKAAKGEVAPGGRTYDLENEVAAVLTGARRQDLDVAQALIFRAKRYAGEKRGAELIWQQVRDRRGNVETADLENAKATMEEVRRALFDLMREDVAAAQRLGVDRGVTVRALIGAGMSAQEAALLVSGVYLPYLGQPDVKQRAIADGVTARP